MSGFVPVDECHVGAPMRRQSARPSKRDEKRNRLRAFIVEALRVPNGPVPAYDAAERVAAFDARISAIAGKYTGKPKLGAFERRQDGIEAIQLLIDRHHVETDVFVRPAQDLVSALRSVHENQLIRSPLLSAESEWETSFAAIDAIGHNWIRASSVAAMCLLQADHQQPQDTAATSVSDALQSAEYRPFKGSPTTLKSRQSGHYVSAIKKWESAALSEAPDVSDMKCDTQAALWNLVILIMDDKITDEDARRRDCSPRKILDLLERIVRGFQLAREGK
jgi:hypothetical protein